MVVEPSWKRSGLVLTGPLVNWSLGAPDAAHFAMGDDGVTPADARSWGLSIRIPEILEDDKFLPIQSVARASRIHQSLFNRLSAHSLSSSTAGGWQRHGAGCE